VKIKNLPLILLLVIVSSRADAQGEGLSKIYARLSGGLGLMAGENVTQDYVLNGVGTQQSVAQTFDGGYQGDLGFGYRYHPNLRTELAVGYLYNTMSSSRESNGINTLSQGYSQTVSYMFNNYYDFNDWQTAAVPYLGVGIGYLENKMPYNQSYGAVSYTMTKEQYIGYQGIAGLNYKLPSGFSLLLDYRYLASTSTQTVPYSTSTYSASNSNVQLVYSLVSLGLMYQFS